MCKFQDLYSLIELVRTLDSVQSNNRIFMYPKISTRQAMKVIGGISRVYYIWYTLILDSDHAFISKSYSTKCALTQQGFFNRNSTISSEGNVLSLKYLHELFHICIHFATDERCWSLSMIALQYSQLYTSTLYNLRTRLLKRSQDRINFWESHALPCVSSMNPVYEFWDWLATSNFVLVCADFRLDCRKITIGKMAHIHINIHIDIHYVPILQNWQQESLRSWKSKQLDI